jgi:glutamate/aspartate transport system permease protein
MTDLDFFAIIRVWPLLVEGMGITFTLTFIAAVTGFVGGVLLAVMRLSGVRLFVWISAGYVNTIRSVPLILVIFWFYFLVPLVLGRPIGGFYSALIAFTIFEAAYFSEIIRSGIKSVSSGQLAAARATGMSYLAAMRHVVLPQAIRNMTPVLLTQCIALFQDTSLVYVVGLNDFLTTSSVIAARDGRLIEFYLFAAVVYFTISFAAASAVGHLLRRKSA